MKYINLDEWVSRQRGLMREQDHQLLLEAFELHDEAWDMRHTRPQQAVVNWQRAVQLAEQGAEPCLALYFQNRLCAGFGYFLGDYRTALDIAVRMVVEARKYPTCPMLSSVYRSAISIKLRIDPHGYADQIAEMFAHVENHVTLDYSRLCLLTYDRIEFAYALDETEQALLLAQRYFELCLAHPSPHQVTFMGANAAEILCHVYALREDWEQVRVYALECERYARRSSNTSKLIYGLYWQALSAHYQGEMQASAVAFDAAEAQRAVIEHRIRPYYYHLSRLYLVRGDHHLILPLLDETIAIMQQGGEIYSECMACLHRCCLLGWLGKSFTAELEETQQVILQLREPARLLQKLECIAQGDFDLKLFCP